MSFRILAAVVALALPVAVVADETDHPYKNAKKGQWIAYKATISVMGNDLNANLKQTVADVTDKSVTIEITGDFNGMEIPAQKQNIDLTKPFNPLTSFSLPGGAAPMVEKKESGKEKIKAGGKEFDSEWTTYKVSIDAGGMKIEGDLKSWIAKDIGLGGMVKQEMKSDVFSMTMELESFGKD